MTITFNPDPKLQAEAMIEQFRPNADATDFSRVTYDSAIEHKNAKESALIAAEMCKECCNQHGEYYYPDVTMNPPQVNKSYWSAVIEELKKL